MIFLPRDEAQRAPARQLVEQGLAQYGLTLLGWRGCRWTTGAWASALAQIAPGIEQALIGRSATVLR